MDAQKVALEKTVGAGQKIDTTLTLVRIGFFFGDNTLVTDHLSKAEACVPPPLPLPFPLPFLPASADAFAHAHAPTG